MTSQQIAKRRIVRVKNDISFLNLIRQHTAQGYICRLPDIATRFYVGNVVGLMRMLKEKLIIKKFRTLRKRDLHLKKACFDENPLIDKNTIHSSPVIWTVDRKRLESLLAEKSNELSRLEEQVAQGVSL